MNANNYALSHKQWEPGNYENRSKNEESGHWTCKGNSAVLSTNSGEAVAEYKETGKNPLKLPATAKALIFMPSENFTLSQELLYQPVTPQ
ncbi:MAG: hypothetical protein K6L80_15970 [Agarilytica sp.]